MNGWKIVRWVGMIALILLVLGSVISAYTNQYGLSAQLAVGALFASVVASI